MGVIGFIVEKGSVMDREVCGGCRVRLRGSFVVF